MVADAEATQKQNHYSKNHQQNQLSQKTFSTSVKPQKHSGRNIKHWCK
jgi:hypothetical protein